MRYFDAHCHIQFEHYDNDREVVLGRMEEEQIGGLLVGTSLASSKSAIALADGNSLFASVGLHPNHVEDEVFDEEVMRTLASESLVVAIGECGLDFYRPEDVVSVRTKQEEVFRAHIRIARDTRKPLMVHARPSKGTDDAYEVALTLLAEVPEVRANFHFFVGSPSMGKRIAELGHTCSFTAVLTFTKDYDELVRSLPLEAIITETDAPYAAPLKERGKRNDPLAVIEVVSAIARIRGEDEEVVRRAVLANALRVFGVGPEVAG